MKYRFFSNSMKSWEAMYEAISSAQVSIYLEMYIFEDITEKFHFFEALKQKAKKGIEVRLILDAFGSMELSKAKIKALKTAGVEVLFQSYLLHRAHRKILVIDKSIAFIGGVNFDNTSGPWNDLVVRIEGVLVGNIVKSFAKSYRDAGGKDIALLEIKNISLSRVNAWLVEHSPLRKLFTMKKVYQEHLGTAKNRIILVTPYFIPKRWLSAALHQAVLRGVTVEVLLPAHTNPSIIDRVNYFYMHRFSSLGIKFYLESTMNHAKAMIIDTDEALVGSQNIDFFSFDLNSEIGVFFHDAEVVSELLKITDEWKRDATLFDPKKYTPRWFDKFLSSIFAFFGRIF